MNKEIVLKQVKNKFNGELLQIVLNQIDNYLKLDESDYTATHNYKVGNSVILNSNHLLHGIGNHLDILETISKRGIVSQDFFGVDSNHAFCYNSAFWNVKEKISLKNYIKNYSGMVVKYNNQYELVPYGELDAFVEKMRNVDHWLWTAESSMEIRFMPSLARNVNQIGFIVNMENEIAQKLKSNSIFTDSFKKEYSLEFVSEKSKEKFGKNGFIDDFFERADYLIFGVPSCCIEGIIVGRKLENNIEELNKLKSLFINCYICNLNGNVIVE